MLTTQIDLQLDYELGDYKAAESGEFTFTWKDDDGSNYVSKNKITVG